MSSWSYTEHPQEDSGERLQERRAEEFDSRRQYSEPMAIPDKPGATAGTPGIVPRGDH